MPTRWAVLVDLGEGTLLADRIRLDELLLTLRRWWTDSPALPARRRIGGRTAYAAPSTRVARRSDCPTAGSRSIRSFGRPELPGSGNTAHSE
jgi:hypothetical protein